MADNGRDDRGRFVAGCAGGPGNPHSRRVNQLRSALLDAVDEADIREIAAALVADARGGDVQAAREILRRVLGPPVAVDILERLEALEAELGQAR